MNLPLRDFADVVAALKGASEKAGSAEVRRAARMTVFTKISVHIFENSKVGRGFSVITRDVSINGIGVLQSMAMEQGKQVVLTLPRNTKPLYIVAKVMHCRTLADGLMAVGMEFVSVMDEATAKQLTNRDADELARLQKSILD